MTQISVEDIYFDEAVVGILTKDTGPIKKVITLDLDPYENECVSIMHYTAEQARELASALIKAAEEVEKQ